MMLTGIISGNSRFASLTAFLLLLSPAVLAKESQGTDAIVQYSTTIEFDVVFPRNDTYAPTAVFPIIFALQNPKAAAAFRPLSSWYLGKIGNNITDLLEEDHTDVMGPRGASEPAGSLGWHGISNIWHTAPTNITSDPHYLVYWTDKLKSPNAEGQYWLRFEFDTFNCTDSRIWRYSDSIRTKILFTIKEGAKAPDLVAKPGVCPTFGGALRASEEFQMQRHPGFGTVREDQTRCVHLTDEQLPTDPCRANMNETAASSILEFLAADASAVACKGSTNTTACPAESLGYRLFPGFWPMIASLTALFAFSASQM